MSRFPAGSHADEAWAGHEQLCVEVIGGGGHRTVCEIGGGRTPLLRLDQVRELDVEYTVMDVSQGELDEAPEGYETVCADICDPGVAHLGERFDVVLSRMVAEHVPDGLSMHRNVFGLLRPGGVAFHFFPTLFTPVFVANRLVPDRVTRGLQHRFAARPEPKFPARYSLCRGPTPRAVATLTGMGYVVEEYRPFYGTDYLKSVPLLGALDNAVAGWAARRRNPYLSSYAYLRLRKPAAGRGR